VGAINGPNHIFEEGVDFGIVENEWWNWMVGKHGWCRKGERRMHAG